MHFKHFPKKNNFIILLLYLLFNNFTAQTIKSGDAFIINVILKTNDIIKDNSELLRYYWGLYYVVIDNKVYSGDIFEGRNFTCKVPRDFFEKNRDYMIPPYEDMKLIEKKMDALKYRKFKSGIEYIDTNFYWKCIKVSINYLELPCIVQTPDFFKFVYKGNNGLAITKLNSKKIKKCNFPKFFLELIIKNEKCLYKLDYSYTEFEKCLK